MEPLGFCGVGLVGVGLLLVAVIGLAVVAGGLVLLLVKLGTVADQLRKPEVRGESDHYALDQAAPAADDGPAEAPAQDRQVR